MDLSQINPEFWKFLGGLITFLGTCLVTLKFSVTWLAKVLDKWAEDKASLERIKGENRVKELEAAKEVERLKAEYSATVIIQLKKTVDGLKPSLDLVTEQVASLMRVQSSVVSAQEITKDILASTNKTVEQFKEYLHEVKIRLEGVGKTRAEAADRLVKIEGRVKKLENGLIYVQGTKKNGR